MNKKETPESDPEKDQERQRFLDYIGDKNLTDIAEQSGLVRQSLYYIQQHQRYLTINIHRAMAKAFRDYDINWIMFGIERSESPNPAGPVGETADDKALFRLQAENMRLKTENEFLKRERDTATQEKAQYWKMLEQLHEQKLDFPEVSTQTTDSLFPDYSAKPVAAFTGFDSFTLIGPKKPVSTAWFPGQGQAGAIA